MLYCLYDKDVVLGRGYIKDWWNLLIRGFWNNLTQRSFFCPKNLYEVGQFPRSGRTAKVGRFATSGQGSFGEAPSRVASEADGRFDLSAQPQPFDHGTTFEGLRRGD